MIVGMSAQEKAFISEIEKILAIELEENDQLFFLRTEWSLKNELGRLTRNSPNAGELIVNLYGLRKALTYGKKWGDQLRGFLCQYFAQFLRLSSASDARMPKSYEEGLAICDLILRNVSKGGIRIPVPASLRGTMAAGSTKTAIAALYCESEALRFFFPDITEKDKAQIPANSCAKELLLWSELPEIMYTEWRGAQIAPLYIADHLEKQLRKDRERFEEYTLFREICKEHQEIGIREYWIKKGIETEEPFYEGMMVRMIGYEPYLWSRDWERDGSCPRIAEAAEDYIKKTARFIITGSHCSTRAMDDNRTAAESAAGNLRKLLDRAGLTESSVALYPSVR